MNTCRIS
jgi:hypothetical protein